MLRYIFTLFLLCFVPVSAFASQQYYNFPDASSLPDAGRILMYDGSTSKNITGSKLKSEVLGGSGALIKQAPASATTGYERQLEMRDSSGIIKMWINARGQQVFGTPVQLTISSVYPANGATGVDKTSVPFVIFNKTTVVDISTAYINGNSTAPSNDINSGFDGVGLKWGWITTLAGNTTYTIKVLRSSIQQTDGETGSSCGAMVDVSGVCQITFTTGP